MASKRREGFPLPRNFLARYLPSLPPEGGGMDREKNSRIPVLSIPFYYSFTR